MRTEANLKTPLFQGHGEDDAVVDIKFGERSYEEMKKLDMDVEFHKYQGLGHGADPEELNDLGEWFKKRIGDGKVPEAKA
jgi:predicted esterase